MTTTHAPGMGFGPGDAGHHRRRVLLVAVVVVACAAVVLPLGVRGLDRDNARAVAAAPTTAGTARGDRDGAAGQDPALGPLGNLPALLGKTPDALRVGLREGSSVRVGDVTTGTLRHSAAGWQVVVRWSGRLQPLPTRGAVTLGRGAWVAASGKVYTRVPTGRSGQFRVYAWEPRGGSAYTAPTLRAVSLGQVCFDRSFTAYGTC